MTFIIIFISGLTILMFLLHLVFSRGKFLLAGMVSEIMYGLAVGLPVALASYLKWFSIDPVNPVYWQYLTLLVLMPSLGYKWLNVLKGRESVYQSLIFSIAIFLFMLTFAIHPIAGIISVIAGWVLLIFYFIDVYRYPYLYAHWLSAVIEETAAETGNSGKYSPKPVVIQAGMSKRFVTGRAGLSLIIKPDKVIGRMSKSFHSKLGKPNLEEFFSKLITKIQQNTAK